MKKIMNAKVCVPLILILIGITFFAAHGTWSWTGAFSWCMQFDDGWGISSSNVGWGGMSSGSWETDAYVQGDLRDADGKSGSFTDQGEHPNPSGAAFTQVGNWAHAGSADSKINGVGQDGESHDDVHAKSFSPND
jgi:hypothetical protein